jgi:Legionella pneumophila major outer membrane protein precursor
MKIQLGNYMKKIQKAFLVSSFVSMLHADQAIDSIKTASPEDPNPLARLGTGRSTNWFVGGEAVWLKPLGTNNSSFKDQLSNDAYTISLSIDSYNFQPAFRLLAGFNTNYDGWTTKIIYTNLNYKHNNPYFFLRHAHPPYSARNNEGVTTYTIHMNLGDLDLSRRYKISRHFDLSPHVGIRGLWLKRRGLFTNKNYLNERTGYADFILKDQLIGIECGLDSFYKLPKNFTVFAKLGLAGLVDKQKTTQKIKSSTLPVDYSILNAELQSSTRIVTNVDISVGLMWNHYFSKDRYMLGIEAGYEQHNYLNIQSYTNFERFNQTITDSNFALQGISVGARIDF